MRYSVLRLRICVIRGRWPAAPVRTIDAAQDLVISDKLCFQNHLSTDHSNLKSCSEFLGIWCHCQPLSVCLLHLLFKTSIFLCDNHTKGCVREGLGAPNVPKILPERGWRSRHELPQQRKSSNHDTAQKAKDINEITTCNLFLATHEKLTIHFPGLNVQVPILVWLPVVVYAAAWPIKKNIYI